MGKDTPIHMDTKVCANPHVRIVIDMDHLHFFFINASKWWFVWWQVVDTVQWKTLGKHNKIPT